MIPRNSTAIVVSRNDNYGGNLHQRATLCLNSLAANFGEVIYVDWNSPQDRPLHNDIWEFLPTGIKCITVNQELAAQLVPIPNAQACCEVIGRNIAIRRATQDWIASTNIDIIVDHQEVMHPLDQDTMYVVARHDINPQYHNMMYERFRWDGIEEVQQRLRKFDVWPQRPNAPAGDPSLVQCCGDFQFAHASVWAKVRGFEQEMVFRAFADTNLMLKAMNVAKIARLQVSRQHLGVYHLDHYADGSYQAMHQVTALNNKDVFTRDRLVSTNNMNWGCNHLDLPMEIK